MQEDPNAPGASDGAEVAFLHPAETAPAESSPADEVVESNRGLLRIVGGGALAILQALLMIAILIGSYFIAQRMIANKPEPRKRPAFQTVYTVDTVKPVAQDRQPVFTAYGQTIAARSVRVAVPRFRRDCCRESQLRAGAQVEKGETLVEIDEFEYRGALAEAQANLAEAPRPRYRKRGASRAGAQQAWLGSRAA